MMAHAACSSADATQSFSAVGDGSTGNHRIKESPDLRAPVRRSDPSTRWPRAPKTRVNLPAATTTAERPDGTTIGLGGRMYAHTLSSSTHTLEMLQVMELNERIQSIDPASGECVLITAEFLGLGDVPVQLQLLDRAATTSYIRRQHAPVDTMPGAAQLRAVVAAGAPTFPYLYGVFGETNGGRRRLPAALHTQHLQAISGALRLRHHQWGL
jgi:hypothetical protein